MSEYISLLKKSLLFQGMDEHDIDSILKCFTARETTYKKNEFIFHYGDIVNTIGLVLEGQIFIIKEDFWGNRTILSEISVGSMFAETYAFSKSSALEVSVIASTDCRILFLNIENILHVCGNACSFHTRLIQNILSGMADKNRLLTKKIEHMSQKTTKDKILSYLSAMSLRNGASTFQIPYDRQELADYLGVERSAMCGELSRLQKAGLISYKKNTFTLL